MKDKEMKWNNWTTSKDNYERIKEINEISNERQLKKEMMKWKKWNE